MLSRGFRTSPKRSTSARKPVTRGWTSASHRYMQSFLLVRVLFPFCLLFVAKSDFTAGHMLRHMLAIYWPLFCPTTASGGRCEDVHVATCSILCNVPSNEVNNTRRSVNLTPPLASYTCLVAIAKIFRVLYRPPCYICDRAC